MKKIKDFIIIKLVLKLLVVAFFLVGLIFLLYLFINREDHQFSKWEKIKKVPQVNFFKFFGWKWSIIIVIIVFIAGILWHFPFIRIIEGWLERKKLIDFAQDVHMAMVSADVGKGKTLLLSILARHLPHGIKKVGFVSNVPDAKLLSYNDLNFDEPIPEEENYNIPKYYFVDEVNFLIEGTSFIENRLYHKGVAWLLQISRHQKMRTWMSATRDHHVWASVRHMMNYYVKLGGLKYLCRLGRFKFFTQRIRFYSQSDELEKEFNITVSNLDFALYDSYWLKDVRHFRPTLEGIAEEGKRKREKKRQEWEKKRKEELQREVKERKELERKRGKMKELVKTLEEVLVKKKEMLKNKGVETLEAKEKEEPIIKMEPPKINYQPKKPLKNKLGKKYRKSPSLQDFLRNYKKQRRE